MSPENAKHEAAVDACLTRLKSFLMSPDHGNGQWPDIGNAELNEAHDLVQEALALKWGEDCDGDRPVRFALWARRKHQLVWDIPVCNSESGESDEDRERRLLGNLSTVSGALGSYARTLSLIERELDEVRRGRACVKAAFPVFLMRYRDADPEKRAFGRDVPASLHLSEEEARAFLPEGFAPEKLMQRWATPTLYTDPAGDFAAYRTNVQAHCGQVRPLFGELEKLNLLSRDPRPLQS